MDTNTYSKSPVLKSDVEPLGPLLGATRSRAILMMPNYLEVSAWYEHIPFAFWMTQAASPKVFVELGSHYGVSYFAFCQAVETFQLETQCYAVDHWKGDEHAGQYGSEVYQKVKDYNDLHYSRFSRLVRSTFDQAKDHFLDQSIDLLHIDGLHTYEAVKHDFDTWLPLMSSRGVVLLHDSNVRERGFGVSRLVEELRQDYPVYEFVHGHGLTVVGVGTEQPIELQGLLDSVKDSANKIACDQIFSRLGKGCWDHFRALSSSQKIFDLEKGLKKSSEEIKDARTQNTSLKQLAEKKEKEWAAARQNLEKQVKEETVLRGRVTERLSEIERTKEDWKCQLSSLQSSWEGQLLNVRQGWENQLHEVRKESKAQVEGLALKNEALLAQVSDQSEKAFENRVKVIEIENQILLVKQESEKIKAEKLALVEELKRAQEAQASAEAKLRELAQEILWFENISEEATEALKQKTKDLEKSQKTQNALLAGVPERLVNEGQMRSWMELGRLVRALMDIEGGAVSKKILDKARKLKLVDPEWYLERHPDVKQAKMDPVEHYLVFGWQEGRAPNRQFEIFVRT